MPNQSNFISLDKVTKRFGDIAAVAGISLTILPGEFVFLTGHSGAGKTTLLKLLMRDLTPNEGTIIVDGEDITKLKDNKIPAFRQKIGVVFQDYKLLTERTVRENIEVALAVVGVNQSQWKSRVDQVLKLVGLSSRGDLFPSQLSGGEMQRAALARALVVSPKLILADEPTGNLDWDTSEGIIDLLVQVNHEGKTVVVATHNQMLLKKVKGRIIELKAGKMHSDTPARAVEKDGHQPENGSHLEDKSKIKVRVEEI